MCGIVGFIGSGAVEHTIDGLGILEYRGYDSAGVALLDDRMNVYKTAGKINVLRELVPSNQSTLCIGHTRWATHGAPVSINAHPHRISDIAIVHNGIIENFRELRHGFNHISDTDSEVIAHLLAEQKGSLFERMKNILPQLKGSYAIAAVSAQEPDKIVLARQGSPLLVGIREEGDIAIVASDVQAMGGFCKEAMAMADGDVIELTSDNIVVFNKDNTITRDRIAVPLGVYASQEGHQTYMAAEIFQQPMMIRKTLTHNQSALLEINNEPPTNILFTACGTSMNACLIAQMFLEDSDIISHARLGSELRYRPNIINEDTTLIAVSQSGETADTLEALRVAKTKNARTISVLNRLGSTMARESLEVIYTIAGHEQSVASTKVFTCQLAALYQAIAHYYNISGVVEKINDVANIIEQTFCLTGAIGDAAQLISEAKSVFFLGRGYGYPVAAEGALKLKEISYIHAEAYPAGELKHGPIALIDEDVYSVVIATDSSVYSKIVSNIEEIRARGGKIIAIATEGNSEIRKIANEVIFIPKVSDAFMPFVATVVLQLLALYTAEILGTDVDRPRNLAKSVTVE